jgi:hypothetical protein
MHIMVKTPMNYPPGSPRSQGRELEWSSLSENRQDIHNVLTILNIMYILLLYGSSLEYRQRRRDGRNGA